VYTAIDLFCGAGGLTAGFQLAGFQCLYGNDFNPSAIETFKFNHPEAWADHRRIESIDPRSVRRKLRLEKGQLSVLTGGPPCQGFSINAPDRFLEDPRNALFKHYMRPVNELAWKTSEFAH
jgi:DNA (cytosine-5)-methyltransferase 1